MRRDSVTKYLVSAVILAIMYLYVIPLIHPTFFFAVLLFVGILIVSDSISKFLSGSFGAAILIPAVFVIVGLMLLMVYFH